MTESEKTTIWIPISYHTKLKIRAAGKRITIEEEIEQVLEKEFSLKEE